MSLEMYIQKPVPSTDKEKWKEKWEYWLNLTKKALKRLVFNINLHLPENEYWYWQIIRHFAYFFSCDLGYEGPDPKQIFSVCYGELFAKYLVTSPSYSWMRKKNLAFKNIINAKQFIAVLRNPEKYINLGKEDE